jgi:hypothetical protein
MVGKGYELIHQHHVLLLRLIACCVNREHAPTYVLAVLLSRSTQKKEMVQFI